MPQINGKQIKDATITNNQISAGAAIALSKLAEAVIQADGGQAFTADQSMGSKKLTNLADGTAAGDAVNKGQLDSAVAGLDWKQSVVVATTVNGALATAYEDGDTIDGVVLATGDRILLKDQTDPIENGIYIVNASGAPTRSTDTDGAGEVDGAAVFVEQGTTNADTGWTQTEGSVTPGTASQTWVQFTGTGSITAGAGLSKTGDTINVGDANKGVQVNADDLEFAVAEVLDFGGGLKAGSASYKIVVEPSDFSGFGLEDDGSDNLRIATSAAGNGLSGGGGTALTVLANGDSISVGGLGVKSSVQNVDRGNSAVTTGAAQDTGQGISKTPGGDSAPMVFVNGIALIVARTGGEKTTAECYYSADGGLTARATADIVSGDSLYFNGDVAGYDLAVTDVIHQVYDAIN